MIALLQHLLQQTADIAVIDLMRSMMEAIEEQRNASANRKKKPTSQKDEAVKTQPQLDESQRVVNEKISAYLFDFMKPGSRCFRLACLPLLLRGGG